MLFAAHSARAADAWGEWHELWRNECPSHHVESMCGDCYLNVIEAFEGTLSKKLAARVVEIADSHRRCATEEAGFSCEFSRSLIAYRDLGLMRRFAHFSCEAVKCEEVAVCSRMPPGP